MPNKVTFQRYDAEGPAPAWVIASRVKDLPRERATVAFATVPCTDCAEPCWIAPSTVGPMSRGAKVICSECLSRKMGPDDEVIAASRELDHLPPAMQRFLKALVARSMREELDQRRGSEP